MASISKNYYIIWQHDDYDRLTFDMAQFVIPVLQDMVLITFIIIYLIHVTSRSLILTFIGAELHIKTSLAKKTV